MKLEIIALVVLFALVLLIGCASDIAEYGYDADFEIYELDEFALEYTEPYPEDGEVSEAEYAPAPGLWDYTFIWPQGRNREWEEDIIYFAQTFLFVHPIMRNVQTPITDARSILHDANISNYTENFHNPELRNQFLESIHDLISDIPELKDHEILLSMSEIAALLEDAHTGFTLGATTFQAFDRHYYPFFFTHFSDGFFVERVWATPNHSSYEKALYSRLLAINGIELSEIILLLSNVLSHENDYDIFAQISLFDIMRHSEVLDFLGITDESETEFAFENTQGDRFSITASPYADLGFETISTNISSDALLTYSRMDRRWYEFLHEYNAMYVRLQNFFWAPSSLSFADFYQSLAEETRRALGEGDISCFVIDLRGNRGGFLDYFDVLFDLLSLERNRIGSVYVLIDNYTYSSGVVAAAILREYISDVLLIGEPASQPPNFFAAPSVHLLPNFDISFSVSRVFFQILPEFQENALYPDILIPWTFENYRNGHDPVLETIWSVEY